MNVSNEECVQVLVEAYKKNLPRYIVAKAFGIRKNWCVLGAQLVGYRFCLREHYGDLGAKEADKLNQQWKKTAGNRAKCLAFLRGER